ncbi:MAG: c-type cytochrome [Acidimicrobiia bacterium]|nr:c-type cytochrome [Acidimicrobiia bacterium]
MKLLLALPFGSAAVAGLMSFTAPTPAAQPDQPADALGRELFTTQCASCHGSDGEGVEDRGPTLVGEGEAAVDFVLRTGRMPMADPEMQATRGPVRYSEEEIEALVAYAGAFGDGPQIPDVDADEGDLAAGGELYRLNCAACHVASGSGAAIGGGREAPSLAASSATEIGESIVVGPGAMPAFDSFTESDINGVAAYVRDLQRAGTTAIDGFGGAGPVAEGLAAWLLGLIPLIAITRWIGSPHEGRDAPIEVEEDTP